MARKDQLARKNITADAKRIATLLRAGHNLGNSTARAKRHDLLSYEHEDTSEESPTRGDIIIANSSPVWAVVAHPGAGYALVPDASDVGWDQTPTWTGLHTFTAAPSIELDVATGDPTIVFDTQGADKFTIGVDDDDSDSFKISMGGSLGANDRLIITLGGRVGVDVTSPSAKLHVDQNNAAGTISAGLFDQGNASYPVLTLQADGADQDFDFIELGVTGTPTFAWDESESAITLDVTYRNAAWTEKRDGWDLRDTQQELNAAIVRAELYASTVAMNEVHGIGGIVAIAPCAAIYAEVTSV